MAAGPTGGPTVISGHYDICHSLQRQIYYAHFTPLQHSRTHRIKTVRNGHEERSWILRHWMLAMVAQSLCDQLKKPTGQLRDEKQMAEYCGADYTS